MVTVDVVDTDPVDVVEMVEVDVVDTDPVDVVDTDFLPRSDE